MAPTEAAADSAGSGAKPRRKKKRPAGSKWLNRLLALGCLAALSPLAFEFYQHRKSEPLQKPHKDDPWVRVIDAAPPEEALKNGGDVRRKFRRHPRHDRSNARVTAEGQVVDDDDDSSADATGEERSAEHAGKLEERLVARARGTDAAAATHVGSDAPDVIGRSVPDMAAGADAKVAAPTVATAVANATGGQPATGGHWGIDEGGEEELRHYFRSVDRNKPPSAVGAGSAASGRVNRTGGPNRLWKTIPGGVHDIIEGSGENATTFSVDGVKPPALVNGSYIADHANAFDRLAMIYMNRNLTWVDRLTPFRVLVLTLPRQPRDAFARRQYATQLMRHWYGASRMLERTALIVMSLDGAVEIIVGHQCKLVLSDGIARHFAIKAMELIAGHVDEMPVMEQRVTDTAQKLVYYVSFTVRSRTQATAMSMRSMSMFMMMFMMMTIVATKQQQARRYAEIYGIDPYARRAMYGGMYGGRYGHRGGFEDELFWTDFESGRRGGALQEQRERAHHEAFFRLQILQMLMAQRSRDPDDDYEEEEDFDDEEGEEEAVLLSADTASFYEEERRDANGNLSLTYR